MGVAEPAFCACLIPQGIKMLQYLSGLPLNFFIDPHYCTIKAHVGTSFRTTVFVAAFIKQPLKKPQYLILY